MFCDLLLWSFLSSGIFLISAMLLISMLYSSVTTKIQYLKTVRKLCTLQHTFTGERYSENIELCVLKHLPLLARWDPQALWDKARVPLAAQGAGLSPPCGGGASGTDTHSAAAAKAGGKAWPKFNYFRDDSGKRRTVCGSRKWNLSHSYKR